eukprot:CAMPEP_0185568066 /NCGR_PEP_ID=MMETSP0434-20130131/1142_1 /TAXON_ID=626734 ORGANISM="Favella taraikaensis, Strain Fe Narragansett Bay" /NCGR_SAMPLE_ID=MMETSP0434 /ASSEMBLY_ACC=CAM_ASM_000379 /LENGTH=82 /DNA_ID=CAMNT_0028182457 /DNA_START=864 /DNA_END=1112 /DNA_ORIENTATION=-
MAEEAKSPAGLGDDVAVLMDVDEHSSGSAAEESKTEDFLGGGISQEILKKIAAGQDCYIGDAKLLSEKKSLTAKFTPMSLVS